MKQIDPAELLKNSTLIADKKEVEAAVERLANDINHHYGEQPIILLVALTGAIMPAAWIASRLKMPLQMDFVHASRYSGSTEGGEVEFPVPPRLTLENQHVLIVDDIYDIGLTLQMIGRYCVSRGAKSVNSAVLVRKIHDRKTTDERPAFIGMNVEDKYVFGCGMDAYEHWRHLDEIRALEPR